MIGIRHHDTAADAGIAKQRTHLRRLVEQLAPELIEGERIPRGVLAHFGFLRSERADELVCMDGGFVRVLDAYAEMLGLMPWPTPTDPIDRMRVHKQLAFTSVGEVHAMLLRAIDELAATAQTNVP